jgi:peptide/nickel transport system permease protein
MKYGQKKYLRWVVLCGFLVVLLTLALLAPILPLPHPHEGDLSQRLLPPLHEEAMLGTDTLGRDIMSRLIWGTRNSLAVALSATLLAAFLGSMIGITSGYFRGWYDALAMRGIDLLMAFPYLILALAIVAILGPGLINALLAIAIVNIPFFARTARGVTLGLNQQAFVEAARMGGQGHFSILRREIIPNVFPTLLITGTTTLGWMILETAGLSFLGLGAQPPTADLGAMLAEGRKIMLVHPHIALLPGLVIFLLVLSLNLLGDTVRDHLDPRLRGGALTAPGAATVVVVNHPRKIETKADAEVGPPEEADAEVGHPKAPSHFLAFILSYFKNWRVALRRDQEPTEGRRKTEASSCLLDIQNLRIAFGQGEQEVIAVKNLDLRISRGETVGLVGESGSGKSATAMAITRLLPSPQARILSGEVVFDGMDLIQLNAAELRKQRGSRISYVFQDPLGSLNPLMPVGRQIVEALHLQKNSSAAALKARAIECMERTGIPDPAAVFQVLPHELSGGQRQRIGIAMAIANRPDLIIADEPTTALDVTVQKKVLETFQQLVKEEGMAVLFISHDLGVVQSFCQRLYVLQSGEVVESGAIQKVLGDPQHPYTRKLISCIPVL